MTMTRKQHIRALGIAAAIGAGSVSVALVIGGAESAGFFKESAGFEAGGIDLGRGDHTTTG